MHDLSVRLVTHQSSVYLVIVLRPFAPHEKHAATEKVPDTKRSFY